MCLFVVVMWSIKSFRNSQNIFEFVLILLIVMSFMPAEIATTILNFSVCLVSMAKPETSFVPNFSWDKNAD